MGQIIFLLKKKVEFINHFAVNYWRYEKGNTREKVLLTRSSNLPHPFERCVRVLF